MINNGSLIWKLLGINSEDLLFANTYFQKKGTCKLGCQIDYLIQTRFHHLYACAVKFRQGLLGKEIIEEVEQKNSSV